jgi:hypothetical protein
MAQRRSVLAAAELFKLSHSEVKRIDYVLNKEIVLEQPALSRKATLLIDFATAIDLGVAFDPESPECNDLLEDMDSTIRVALGQLKLGSRLRQTYPQEFSQAEFGAPSRSDFGWVYAALRSMDNANVEMCFGKGGVKFKETCELTNWRRLLRKDCFLRARKIGTAIVSMASIETSTEAVRPPAVGNTSFFHQTAVSAGPRLFAMKLAKPCYAPQIVSLTIDFCCAFLKEAA